MRVNKEDLVHLLLDNQGEFNFILDDFINNFGELKAKFTELEADENVDSKLSDRLINVDQNILQICNTPGYNVWKFRKFHQAPMIMNWRSKYPAFWKEGTHLQTLDW